MFEKENQPFLLTQNAITEAFKRVIGFCALKRGDATSVAISLESPEARLASSGAGRQMSLLSGDVISDRVDQLLSCVLLHREEPTVAQLRRALSFACLLLTRFYQA